MKKCVCIISEAGYKVAETMILIMVLAVIILRLVLPMCGLNPLICISNSMYPTFEENSICYIDENIDRDSIKAGDIIAFCMDNGTRVTHRVVDVVEDGFITKGDANDTDDLSIVTKTQVIGINKFQIPQIGMFFREFPNKNLLMLVGPVVLFLIGFRILCDTLNAD